MKEIEPTPQELAELQATSSQLNLIVSQLQSLQQELQKWRGKQNSVIEGIKDRVDDCPDTPPDKWILDDLSFLEGTGTIKIPEEGEAQEMQGRRQRGQPENAPIAEPEED